MVSMGGDKWSVRIGRYGCCREYGWWALWALCSLVSRNKFVNIVSFYFNVFFFLYLLVGEMVKICLVGIGE